MKRIVYVFACLAVGVATAWVGMLLVLTARYGKRNRRMEDASADQGSPRHRTLHGDSLHHPGPDTRARMRQMGSMGDRPLIEPRAS